MTRYEHKGGAVPTTLTAEIAPDALTIPIAASDGWPDGTVGPFWVAINKGALTEEKILCSSRTGLVVQVFSDVGGTGRAADDTVAHTHPINSPIEHVWTATEADQANTHVNTGSGAHGYPAITDVVVQGGTAIAMTHMSVAGAQAEAEFRVRNTYIGTGVPDNALGNDGDIYIQKA